jgi:hypothetical protein
VTISRCKAHITSILRGHNFGVWEFAGPETPEVKLDTEDCSWRLKQKASEPRRNCVHNQEIHQFFFAHKNISWSMPAEFGKRMLDRLGFTVPEMISAAKRMYVPCLYVCMYVRCTAPSNPCAPNDCPSPKWLRPACLSLVSKRFLLLVLYRDLESLDWVSDWFLSIFAFAWMSQWSKCSQTVVAGLNLP